MVCSPGLFFCRQNPSCKASYPSVSLVFTWVTTHGPASITVTGTNFPSGVNTPVIPSFLPNIPLLIAQHVLLHSYFHFYNLCRIRRVLSVHGDGNQEFGRFRLISLVEASIFNCQNRNGYSFISTSTPGERSNFIRASTVC